MAENIKEAKLHDCKQNGGISRILVVSSIKSVYLQHFAIIFGAGFASIGTTDCCDNSRNKNAICLKV